MALSRVTVWSPGNVLTSQALNAEFDNILTDALSLISPWTNNMSAGGFSLTGLALGTAASPSLQFTGDTDTGSFSPGANQYAIATGGTSRFAIDSSGNVGIGTTGPVGTLDVRGQLLVGAQTTSLDSSIQLQIARANNPIMAFRHLNAAAATQQDYTDYYFKNTGGTETVSARLSAYHATTNATQPGAELRFSTANAGGSLQERVTIDQNGNVGIGTTSFGTNAVTVVGIGNGTAPTTGPADTIQLYSSDDAAGHTIPSFYCEGTNVLATGQADSASSVRVKMRINGTVVTLLAI